MNVDISLETIRYIMDSYKYNEGKYPKSDKDLIKFIEHAIYVYTHNEWVCNGPKEEKEE